MKTSAVRLEKQRRLVARLRQQLLFETLVLDRMEGRNEADEAPELRSVADVLDRARCREAGRQR